MALSTEVGGSLIDFNVGMSAAVALIFPLGLSIEGLSAQIDALFSIGLGPFQAELAIQFNASLALQATLTLQIGDPTFQLQLAISALAQLQAALVASLQFPPINVSLSAELSASLSLAAALSVRIGLLKVAIEVALKIKLGALKLMLGTIEAATDLQLSLTAGPAWAFSFYDENTYDTGPSKTLKQLGAEINDRFALGVGVGDPQEIDKDSTGVWGVVMMTKVPVVQAALSAIISV